jgi:hypothetical protein
MANRITSKAWSPYLAGALTGVLMALSVLIAGKYFGASASYVKSVGLLEGFFTAERIEALEYFRRTLPQLDWQWMFVAGILIGSFLSAILSGSFRFQLVPDMWRSRFGINPVTRALVAFCGGAVAMFGARLAGGGPSGHGLSGTLQLAVSGYVALVCFFAVGVITAHILYRR